MLTSSRKGENVTVVDHHVTLSPADSGSAKSKSSNASSRASERSSRAKAELLLREVELRNGDLNQVGRSYSRSELNPTAEPWCPAPSLSAASGEDPIVSQRLQQVLG